jgi:hypothetical protein
MSKVAPTVHRGAFTKPFESPAGLIQPAGA